MVAQPREPACTRAAWWTGNLQFFSRTAFNTWCIQLQMAYDERQHPFRQLQSKCLCERQLTTPRPEGTRLLWVQSPTDCNPNLRMFRPAFQSLSIFIPHTGLLHLYTRSLSVISFL